MEQKAKKNRNGNAILNHPSSWHIASSPYETIVEKQEISSPSNITSEVSRLAYSKSDSSYLMDDSIYNQYIESKFSVEDSIKESIEQLAENESAQPQNIPQHNGIPQLARPQNIPQTAEIARPQNIIPQTVEIARSQNIPQHNSIAQLTNISQSPKPKENAIQDRKIQSTTPKIQSSEMETRKDLIRLSQPLTKDPPGIRQKEKFQEEKKDFSGNLAYKGSLDIEQKFLEPNCPTEDLSWRNLDSLADDFTGLFTAKKVEEKFPLLLSFAICLGIIALVLIAGFAVYLL